MLVAIIILSIALLSAVAYIFSLQNKAARLDERLQLSEKTLIAQRDEYEKDIERQQAEFKKDIERQRSEFERINAEAEQRFTDLATKALAQNSEVLRRQTNQGLSEVLAPMKENIDQFRQTIIDSYSKEARERFSLGERVRELIELNQTVGQEARRLSDALKGNTRMQGNWGEMILDNILERAGFRRGFEYQVQESIIDSEGRRLRPDVIISYTEGRKIVIDSKVSIQDYFEMLNATDDIARDRHAKAHIASVKKHIAELRTKSYQNVVGNGEKFDYVLMFIPHEGAFLAAMSIDNTLWETAYDSRVLIISPTHLMAIVKLIEQMWRQDLQNRNAVAIAEEAGRMLDKLRGFLDDMERIDKSLTGAHQALDDAYKKLSTGAGNLIGRAEKMQALGAKAKKALPSRFLPDTTD